MTESTESNSHSGLVWMIVASVLIVAALIGGYKAGQGFAAQDVEDFGKARLNGEIYACKHEPKFIPPVPMSKAEAIDAAKEKMGQD
jgi:hypothetical protein